MKILVISTSPRKSFSTSLYFSRLLKLFLAGHSVQIISLKTVRDYENVISAIKHTDVLVFASPVYVDTLPSTTLSFLQKLERDMKQNDYHLKVYAMLNCGFYEGHQCSLALNTYALWCEKAKIEWCGGIGIGSGVMIGFIRCLPLIGLCMTALEQIIKGLLLLFQSSFSFSGLFTEFLPINLIIQTVLWLLFSMGAFLNIGKLCTSVCNNRIHKIRFTTVWFCPRFLFVVLASLYWILRALILHGVLPWKLFKKNTE